MKTISAPSVVSPVILVLALLAVVVIYVTIKDMSLPLLSNLKMNLAILLILGMIVCAQGGIGRIAANGEWSHPLSILGYLLGASILILSAVVFFNISLPFLTSQQQAFLIIAVLMGLKVLNSLAHYYVFTRR
jgi:hypothetical protein